MRIVSIFVIVSCASCGARPPPPPPPADWCALIEDLGKPDDMECQKAPGYFKLGFFGPRKSPTQHSFAFYIPQPAPEGFAVTVESGPSIERSYMASARLTAAGGLDLSTLPPSLSEWLPTLRFGKGSTSSVRIHVKLRDIKYRSTNQTLSAIDSAIRTGKGGMARSDGCERLLEFKRRLCEPGVKASFETMTVTPTLDVATNDASSLTFDSAATKIAGTTYSSEQKASDRVVLTAGEPIAVAVNWVEFAPDGSCRTTPDCPSPPLPVYCDGTQLKLPEARGYTITETGFDGGGAHRTSLVFRDSSNRDAEVDTLPFNGSKEKGVSGPGSLFVCSTNRQGGGGGCEFSCTGTAPHMRFTYPAGDGFGGKHANLQVTSP